MELLSAGIAAATEGGVDRRHYDDHYSFEYVLSGKGTVTLGGEQYRVRSRDAYILPRDMTHSMMPDRTDPWSKIWFAMRGTLVDTLIDLYGLRGVCHIPRFSRSELFFTVRDIAKTGSGGGQAAEVFHSFCIRAREAYGARHSADVALAIRYLDAHAMGDLSIDELTAVMPQSPSQITRRFRAETGTTPYQYFMRKKIERAKLLLSTTEKSANEIARILAFTDPAHFSNTFKKHAGMSPDNYRRR